MEASLILLISIASAITCNPPTTLDLDVAVGIDESSGVAASRDRPGVFYTHNDSGREATLFSFQLDGTVQLHSVPSASNEDWEDIAAAPCRLNGSCLYIADTGDNNLERPTVDIWVVAEPTGTTATLRERWSLRFPDGPRNVETLLVHPCTREAHLLSRAPDGRTRVYRVPSNAGPRTRDLEFINELVFDGGSESRIVTGGDWHPNGRSILIRTGRALWVWDVDVDAPDDHWFRSPTFLAELDGQDGEAATWSLDGDILTTSEGTALRVQQLVCEEPLDAVCTPGCGCSAASGPQWGWLVLLPLLGLRRSVRRPW